MPSYKTHSILALKKINLIECPVALNAEDLKTFAIGPDTLIASDPKIFAYQHANQVKDYFLFLIDTIKKDKLYDDSEVMAFLYGQIDHYILDLTLHPFIYYYTEYDSTNHLIDSHALFEFSVDNYLCTKYNLCDKEYYHKRSIESLKLRQLIDKLYKVIFNINNESIKYNIGINIIKLFDSSIRNSKLISSVTKILNTGDVCYSSNLDITPLNLDNKPWINPETGIVYDDSLIDLFDKAKYLTLEIIQQINNYIYQDKAMTSNLISEDISYNTGLPCKKGQTFKYIKKG